MYSSLGIADSHHNVLILFQALGQGTLHITEDEREATATERIVDYPSVSTHLLLGLLCLWSFASRDSGGMKEPDVAKNCQDILVAMLAMISNREPFPAIVGAQCHWKPPMSPATCRGARIWITGATADFSEVVTNGALACKTQHWACPAAWQHTMLACCMLLLHSYPSCVLRPLPTMSGEPFDIAQLTPAHTKTLHAYILGTRNGVKQC